MALKVFNLGCSAGHRFEGWFASNEDFESQSARRLIECPVCGDAEVGKLPSAPRLNLGVASAQAEAPKPAAAPPVDARVQALVLAMARQIAAQTENVGDRFASEARAIHYEEAPERAIRGVASREEVEELVEEGIAVLPLPFADEIDEPLQ